MSAVLAAMPTGLGTPASASADELTAVLARIRARCRPDLSVTAAQRLEGLLGLLEASRADLRAARSDASGWLGLGSVAFLAAADRAQADAGRAAETIRAGAGALRSCADVAQTCLDRARDIEHRLLVARDERSRRLAAEATGQVRSAGSAVGPAQAFDQTADGLLRAARLVLADADAAIAALVARLGQLPGTSGLPADASWPAPGEVPGADDRDFDISNV